MRSTSSAGRLSVSFRRADVTAFWFVGVACVAAVTSLLAYAGGARHPWSWGGVAGVILVAPGALWPAWFECGVWVWNGSVRRLRAMVRRYALRVTYFMLFPLLRLSGRRGRLTQSDSWWLAVDSPEPQRLIALAATTGGGWYLELVEMARAPRHRWVLVLVPLLFLLHLLAEPDSDAVPPTSTYTLF
jgi:hypothetical protein